jgi:hypothetical protein
MACARVCACDTGIARTQCCPPHAHYGSAVYQDPFTAAAATPMLPAEWLDETLTRARALLPHDDPFMRALERQRDPLPEPRPAQGLEEERSAAGRAAR